MLVTAGLGPATFGLRANSFIHNAAHAHRVNGIRFAKGLEHGHAFRNIHRKKHHIMAIAPYTLYTHNSPPLH